MKRFLRIICVFIVLALVSTCALATTEEEYQARIAELEARVAELEHELAAKDYVAEFDGGFVTVEEAQKQYDYIAYMYQQYGYSMTGYEDYIKQDVATDLAEDAVALYMAGQLGLDQFTDEDNAKLQAEAEEELADYVEKYRYLFEGDGVDEETVTADTLEYLANNGVTAESLAEDRKKADIMQAVFEYCVKDVDVTEEELTAGYDRRVAEGLASYTSDPASFEQALMYGNTVYYVPEGYRNVKNLLVKFDDSQAARYSEITGRISDLEDELAALSDETAEEGEEKRTEEEISADLDAANAELDALYGELDGEVNELLGLIENGTDIDQLIAERGGDPGSVNEDGTIKTYAVSETSASYDPAFTKAAMSIPEVGGISEPARGSYGIYILYYDSDMTPGEVGMDKVKDEIYNEMLDDKRENTYQEQVSAWCEELNLVYYLENFR